MLKLDDINPIIKWFEENYKWFFSGLGVSSGAFLLGCLLKFLFSKGKTNIKAKKSQVTTGGGHNFKIGGDVGTLTINSPPNSDKSCQQCCKIH